MDEVEPGVFCSRRVEEINEVVGWSVNEVKKHTSFPKTRH